MTFLFSAAVPERRFEVDLEIATGETVALLGPNGSGKSTLLAVAAGLLRPDRARVLLDGTPLTDVESGRARVWVPPHARGVALLAQQPLLFPHLDVLDNVAFGPRSQGRSRADARAAARRWLEEVGVADLAERRPARLSGGQAQRVAVARALAAQPRLLLLDEPMAALDVEVTPQLRHTLRDVLAERTAIIATHDALDALLLADRVAVLEEGSLVELGPTDEVLRRPRSAFAARIAGLNLVSGTWDGAAVVAPDGSRIQGLLHEPVPLGHAVVAVFRPASVSVFLTAAGGSPRNAFAATVTSLEPHGDLVRVRTVASDAAGPSADVTPQAVAELGLVPGLEVSLSVKATEVTVYGR